MKVQNVPQKNYLSGQAVGLGMDDKSGYVFLNIDVLNEEEKIARKVQFLLDTGFNGYMQLPSNIVGALKLSLDKRGVTKGFDGVPRQIYYTKTKVRIINEIIWNFPIQVVEQGPALLGTKFFIDTKRMIIVDYNNKKVTITRVPKVQKKVHKAVDKYSQ